VKTAEGYEEEWIRPKWVLNGIRRARETPSNQAPIKNLRP
jgi:hypothetical protein